MLLFKPEHVDPIRSRRKTQTRRSWRRTLAAAQREKTKWERQHPDKSAEIREAKR